MLRIHSREDNHVGLLFIGDDLIMLDVVVSSSLLMSNEGSHSISEAFRLSCDCLLELAHSSHSGERNFLCIIFFGDDF
jgi:hypothetical protein